MKENLYLFLFVLFPASLFNDISTFSSYLRPVPPEEKSSSGSIEAIVGI